uniref:Uncharacterized protein n=1 Tax=Phlebotomus papatasi TaxID=29031 RepID=A0A1B0DI92_PHLPP
MIGSVRGELMDLKNEMQQVEYHADLGSHYRDEYLHMQKELMVMGEIQAKCRDKLSELASLRERDEEFKQLHRTYEATVAELRAGYEQKSSQLERTKARLAELEANLTGRDEIMTEQKRLLKTVKEEFEERFEDRHQPPHHSDVVRTASFESPQTGSIPGSPLPDSLRSPAGQYDSDGQGNDPGSAEDKENQGQSDGTFSQDCEDYDAAAEGSPCSAGGLHIPNSRSMLDFARKFNRWRMHSHCLGDTSQCFSAGTSPAEVAACGMVGGRVMKRSRSWPDIRRSTPPKPPQQNGEGIFVKAEPRQQNIRKPLRELGRMEIVERMDRDTQTIEQWPLAYEHLFINLLSETNKVKQNQENSVESKSPYSMLDRYIELSISKKQAMDTRDQVSMYRDQIQLLTLQLQYERHRREVHAERNRRLLGRNRTNLALELQNETLRKQMMQLGQDYSILQTTLNNSRQHFNKREQELHKDCNTWKLKYNKEVEETKQLRQRIESLENRLADEMKQRQEANPSYDPQLDLESEMVIHLSSSVTTAETIQDSRKHELPLTKDPWLAHGMVDYFCQTNSIRIVEILVKVQSPHDRFIFDRIADHIRGSDKSNRVSALSILGLIIPRHPTWLFRVTAHPLWKDLLKLLKVGKKIKFDAYKM